MHDEVFRHCITPATGISSWHTRKAGLVPARRRVALYLESSEDAEDDTGTGSRGQVAGADFRTHIPQGQVVADAADCRGRAHDLGALRHGPGFHRPLVFRAPVPLPDAVLLAVRQRRMRAGLEHAGPVEAGGTADHPVRVRVAGVRARLPADVLLLPGGVLPGVLACAVRVRGARAARLVLRRDQVPADRAEHAPVLLVRGPVRRHPARPTTWRRRSAARTGTSGSASGR